jgi:hypothetical protein
MPKALGSGVTSTIIAPISEAVGTEVPLNVVPEMFVGVECRKLRGFCVDHILVEYNNVVDARNKYSSFLAMGHFPCALENGNKNFAVVCGKCNA